MTTQVRRRAPRRSARPVARTEGGVAEPAKDAVPGLAPVAAAKLRKLGIRRDSDLVLHLPLRYEDETVLTPIARAAPGAPVQVEGKVLDSEIVYRPRRQLVCRIEDASGELWLRFFNFYPSQKKALAQGARVRAFGEIRPGFFGGEMIHPRFRVLHRDEPLPQFLTPVYPTTAGLAQSALRGMINAQLSRTDPADTLPGSMLADLGLPSFAEAISALHHPQRTGDAAALCARSHPAWRRIKFDELLAQQLSLRDYTRQRKRKTASALADRRGLAAQLLGRLPFSLTAAQARAWGEISADLAQTHPMHRLLQGDVGSGKTVVAALAALRASENGCQTAVMVPTEILAEQHFRKFSQWLAPLGVGVAWLTGGQPAAERREALGSVASGETGIVIGTHALFQEAVEFARLALAIVDEQHRFGVAQRLALRGKAGSPVAPGAAEPHQLMMSATPIPRTLSMSYYADLDVSVIDELPPGRRPVTTKLISEARRDEVVRRIREACGAGMQAYWVCPLIEESEALQLKTALETHVLLTREFPEMNVGLLHGRLDPGEKTKVMTEFAAGAMHLLVATSVIEVGIDVPNASLMVIEHAERFGLAQLHQLRGRIGRGKRESVCILLYRNPLSEAARQRLKIIFENADGFAIARADLLLRGPGEFFGARQSGLPLLRFADLALDEDLLQAARDVAEDLLQNHSEAARRHLERWLGGQADFLKA